MTQITIIQIPSKTTVMTGSSEQGGHGVCSSSFVERLFPGCSAPSVEQKSIHAGWSGIEGPGRRSFEELGWSEDAVLTSDLQAASVRFRLPDDVTRRHALLCGNAWRLCSQ